MSTQTLDKHIEITEEIAGGKPRIRGHRITVQNIVIWYELLGQSADEIAVEYSLSLADVYAALTYYHDNREEIDRSLQQQENFIASLRKKIPSKVSKKLNEQAD